MHTKGGRGNVRKKLSNEAEKEEQKEQRREMIEDSGVKMRNDIKRSEEYKGRV